MDRFVCVCWFSRVLKAKQQQCLILPRQEKQRENWNNSRKYQNKAVCFSSSPHFFCYPLILLPIRLCPNEIPNCFFIVANSYEYAHRTVYARHNLNSWFCRLFSSNEFSFAFPGPEPLCNGHHLWMVLKLNINRLIKAQHAWAPFIILYALSESYMGTYSQKYRVLLSLYWHTR